MNLLYTQLPAKTKLIMKITENSKERTYLIKQDRYDKRWQYLFEGLQFARKFKYNHEHLCG